MDIFKCMPISVIIIIFVFCVYHVTVETGANKQKMLIQCKNPDNKNILHLLLKFTKYRNYTLFILKIGSKLIICFTFF